MFRYCRLRNPTKKPPYGSIIDPHHSLSYGLVVLSLMNEYGGNTAFDASGMQNHGALNSGCSWGIEKESGIILNGSSGYIDCGDDDSTLFQTNSFTLISRFILFDNSNLTSLVNRGYESTGGKRYELQAYNNYVSFQIDDNVAKTQLEYTSDPVTTHIPYFMAGIRDVEADKIRININGINVASMTDNTGNLGDLNGDSLCYGIAKNASGDPWYFFNGIIISTHIYNRALSEEEQFYLYNEPYVNILTPEYWYFCDFGAVSGGLFINVSDNISTGEALVPSVPLGDLLKFDNMTVSELRKLLISIAPDVFENLSLSETVKSLIDISPNVLKNITVLEFIQLILEVTGINTSDHITLSESVSAFLNLAGIHSSENISVSEIIHALINLGISSKTETVNITEVVNTIIESAGIKRSDNIILSEVITALINPGSISKIDSITIIESITAILETTGISKADNVKIQENINLLLGGTGIYNTQGISLSETITATLAVTDITVSEPIRITEITNALMDLGIVFSNEPVILAEITNILMSILPNKFEQVSVSEFVNTYIDLAKIDNSENITISEYIETYLETWGIDVSESIVITEIIKTILEITGISETEALTVAEAVIMALEAKITALDIIKLSEYIRLDLPIEKYIWQSVSTMEYAKTLLNLPVNKAEVFNISETVNALMETVLDLSIGIDQTVIISEYIQAMLSVTGVNTYDSISLTEYVNVMTIFIIGKLRANFTGKKPSINFIGD